MKPLFKQISQRSIGVSPEADALRLAECFRGRIERYAEFPYPSGKRPEGEYLYSFLRSCLHRFSHSYRRLPVWVEGGLPGLQVRFLSLTAAQPAALADMTYWTFRKDLPFDVAQTLFDFGREASAGGRGGNVNVIAYSAPRQETEELAGLYEKAGVRPAGIVIPAFAMRNAVSSADVGQGVLILCLYCGADASTVLLSKDGVVQSCRMFKTGLNAFFSAVTDHRPGCAIPDVLENIAAALDPERSSDGSSVEQIRDAFDRLVQQTERTVAAYLNDHAGETVGGLYLMGAASGIGSFAKALSERLGVPCLNIAPPGVREADGGRMALAAGAALSRLEATPNLLLTYRERTGAAKYSWWSVLAILLLGTGIALGHLTREVFIHRNAQLARRLAVAEAVLAAYSPYVDAPMLERLTGQALSENRTLRAAATRWLPLAAFRALAAQTPPRIMLTSVELIATGAAPAAGRRSSSVGAGDQARLRFKGFVEDAQEVQRSTLASYALWLEDSPLIAQVKTLKVSDGVENGQDVLLFEMEAELAGIGAKSAGGESVKPKGTAP